MSAYAAIILVCLASVTQEDCTEANAVDILSTRVPSELGCWGGWQEVIARSALRDGIGTTTYLKTVCRRLPPDVDGDSSKGGKP
jgi:hypothetical protein